MTSPDTLSHHDVEQVARHFDELGVGEWERLLKTPVDEVNLYLHTHYMKKHAPPGSRVLEIGAGAGRFTQVLATLAMRITVADISPVQLELNRRHAQQYGFAHAVEDWRQVDICDMAQFASRSFDCVVAYGGPFSYTLDQRDSALQECLRALRPDGTLLFSVMSLWGTVHRHLKGVLSIPVECNQKITRSGDLTPQTLPGRTHPMHLFRAAELRVWLNQANLTIVALSASNCLSSCWDDCLKEIRSDDARWNELLRMELEACAEPGSLDMGTHIIGVAKK
jgi:2-polyprenyl-3-methyl-5-hydroxy-6-metoxy-1,4-benzoquinol methylase